MSRILIASVALLGLVGAAAAEAPGLYGSNYSANVLNRYNGTTLQGTTGLDRTSTAAIRNTSREAGRVSASRSAYEARDAQAAAQKERDRWELYSGR